MKKLGILVPLVTPCTRTGEVDEAGLRGVCRDMLGAGCHSIFVAGSTGRGPWFARQDRVRICRTVADEVGKDVLLFAGCMAPGLTDMLENARALADAGAQIAVVTAPGYFNYSQGEVELVFRKFADRSPLPVMIYDIPVFAGMKLDLGVTSRLATHGNIVGFKDSSSDIGRFEQMARLLDGGRDFYLLQGKEHLLADALAARRLGLCRQPGADRSASVRGAVPGGGGRGSRACRSDPTQDHRTARRGRKLLRGAARRRRRCSTC